MTPLQAMYNYAADRPQTDPVNDRLGYRSFSQQLAKGIQNMATPEGFVVAVYGTWGMGAQRRWNSSATIWNRCWRNRPVSRAAGLAGSGVRRRRQAARFPAPPDRPRPCFPAGDAPAPDGRASFSQILYARIPLAALLADA